MIHPLIFTLAATLTACTGPGAPEPTDPKPTEPVTQPETPAAPTAQVEAVAENVSVGRFDPVPHPMMLIPATSASKPSAAAIVSAWPGRT